MQMGGHFFIMALDLDQINNDIERWGNTAAHTLQQTGSAMGIHHRDGSPSPKPSLSQIIARYKYANGLVHVVSFRVPRTLIYTHKGAGKGMGGTKGSSWADKYGQQHKTNQSSFGKMGNGSRREKPFYNQTMESPDGIDQLSDIVVTSIGDAIVNNLLIK
jgi:hypothetical protein